MLVTGALHLVLGLVPPGLLPATNHYRALERLGSLLFAVFLDILENLVREV